MPYLICSYTTLWVSNTTLFKKNITAAGIVNSFLILPTVILNILVISAFIKNKKLRKVSNLILISLTVTDLLSGSVIQPVWVACLFSTLIYPYHHFPCGLVVISGIIGYLMACISLVTVSFISFERYLAIFHPFTHARCITKTLARRTCIILWIVPCPILLGLFFSQWYEVFFWINGIFIFLIYVWNIGIYVRISIRVHNVRRQLLNLHQRFSNRNELVTQSRGTRVASAIIMALLVCYLPHVVESLLKVIICKKFLFAYVEYWTSTLPFLSPCLNPLLYCYYNSEIRKGVRSMLKQKLAGKRSIRLPGVARSVHRTSSENTKEVARTAEESQQQPTNKLQQNERGLTSRELLSDNLKLSSGDELDNQINKVNDAYEQERKVNDNSKYSDGVYSQTSSKQRVTNESLDVYDVVVDIINDICTLLEGDKFSKNCQSIGDK